MPELVVTMAAHGPLRRVSVQLDGREVARLRRGRSVRVKTEPGPHVVSARLDHQSGDLPLDVDDEHEIEVVVEHAFLITDSWTDPDAHAFDFTTRVRPVAG